MKVDKLNDIIETQLRGKSEAARRGLRVLVDESKQTIIRQVRIGDYTFRDSLYYSLPYTE